MKSARASERTHSSQFAAVVASHTISASFAIDTNPIVASAGANGSIAPAGTTNVGYGADQTYTMTPALHYHVANVLVVDASCFTTAGTRISPPRALAATLAAALTAAP